MSIHLKNYLYCFWYNFTRFVMKVFFPPKCGNCEFFVQKEKYKRINIYADDYDDIHMFSFCTHRYAHVKRNDGPCDCYVKKG